MGERGFLYAATGERWVREACASATQLRRVQPGVPIALFTNLPDLIAPGIFDEVVTVPEQKWTGTEVKLWAAARTPFDRTVFLDTDTYPCGDLSDAFNVLDRYDFAAVPVPNRVHRRPDHVNPDDIPDAFQTVNGGMFAWRQNEATKELIDLWWELYQADLAALGGKSGRGGVRDQPSLRTALWRSRCQILLLPPEYNLRTPGHRVEPMIAIGPVRLIHGRPGDIEAIERRWNATTEVRLLTPLFRYELTRVLRRIVPAGLRPRFSRFVRPEYNERRRVRSRS